MVTVAQARSSLGVVGNPPFAKNAKDGALSFAVTRPLLFDGIVWGLAGDHDVVHVAFAQAGAADADEARFLQQLWNRRAAAVAHARLQSADHLVDDHRDRAAVGNASLNTFGDQLG